MERRPCRVLVVEDDATIRSVVAEMLLDEGYEPHLAINGQDGLAKLGSCRPDLIILDLMMPVLDGVAFRAAQRASAAHAAIPVLVLSASRDLPGQVEHLRPAAVVPKPFDLGDLLATVHRLSPAVVEG